MQKITKQELESIDIEPGKLKRFLRKAYWLFSVYIFPQHDASILTRNGRLMFNSKDKTTGRLLHVYRNHEYIEMEETVQLLREKAIIDQDKDGVVVDVGGYIGMSSTGFLLNDLFEKSIAFEPSPENFRLLSANLDLNNLEDRMSAFNIALSDEVGTLEFELSNKNYGDHRIRKSKSKGSYGEDDREVIQIKADTFDTFIEEHPEIAKEKIKLIWMDIQGHEGRFLAGARNFLTEYKSIPVVMEFWPYALERSGVSKKDFLATVTALYKKFYIMSELDSGVQDILTLESHYDEHLNNSNSGSGLNIILFN
ncbi:FkbM family methyltransferase [Sulfurimonas sp.]|nr:FkbM family methyltransferase [Sulfurimonas sp.]